MKTTKTYTDAEMKKLHDTVAIACSEENPEVLLEIAKKMDLNPPRSTWNQMRYNLGLVIAMNPNTPADALDILSRHSHTRVRRCVADHENVSADTLSRLNAEFAS